MKEDHGDDSAEEGTSAPAVLTLRQSEVLGGIAVSVLFGDRHLSGRAVAVRASFSRHDLTGNRLISAPVCAREQPRPIWISPLNATTIRIRVS